MIYTSVYRRILWGGVEIAVYGTCRDWNFAGDTNAEMERNNPFITSAIDQVILEHGIHRAFAPKPAFNARVVKPEDLTNPVLAHFYRGAEADGILLERSKDAYFLASADCPAVILYNKDQHQVLCMHCGLNALADRKAIEGETPREFSSVIDAGITQHFSQIGAARLHGFIAAGIGWRMFSHPTEDNPHAAKNRKLIDYLVEKYGKIPAYEVQGKIVPNNAFGCIDLEVLIRLQLRNQNVQQSLVESDGHDTADDQYHGGTYMFHSNRRDHDQKRNLVMVKLL